MGDELTLEKLKIDERLRRVEESQTTLCADAKHMKVQIDAIYKIMVGNGKVGLITQVDRLDQDKKRQEKHVFAIWVAVIGLAVKTVWEFIVR